MWSGAEWLGSKRNPCFCVFGRCNSCKRNGRAAAHRAHLVPPDTRGNVGLAFCCHSLQLQLSSSLYHLCGLVFKLVISCFHCDLHVSISLCSFHGSLHLFHLFIAGQPVPGVSSHIPKPCSEMLERDGNSSCNLDLCSSSAAARPLACCPCALGLAQKVNLHLGNLVPSQVF